MPRYRAYATITGGKHLGEFVAPNEEKAIEKAERSAHVSLCHQCSGECENAEIEEITVEEVKDE